MLSSAEEKVVTTRVVIASTRPNVNLITEPHGYCQSRSNGRNSIFSYLVETVNNGRDLLGQSRVEHFNVLREAREYTTRGRLVEELEWCSQDPGQQAQVE